MAKGFSLTDSIRIVVHLFISGVVVFIFQKNVDSFANVRLSLQSERPELIQLFFDSGDGFNEAQSSRQMITPAQQRGEPFSLPITVACQRLRLDFGDAGAIVKLLSATLVTSKGNSLDIMDKITSPANFYDVRTSELSRRVFVATANDPYVVLNGEYSDLTLASFSLMSLFKMMLLFVFSFIIIAITDYWVNKKD